MLRIPKRDRSAALQPSNWQIECLPGLNAEDQLGLTELGIHTTLQLLQQANTAARRQLLAGKLQVHVQYVHKWVALADLASIPGVGCEHCGLLLHAGVGSAVQLAQMPPQKLHQQILKLQVAMLQRRDLCPAVDQVAQWIQQARSLCSS